MSARKFVTVIGFSVVVEKSLLYKNIAETECYFLIVKTTRDYTDQVFP